MDFNNLISTGRPKRVSKICKEYPMVQLHKYELLTPSFTIGQVHSSKISVIIFPFFENLDGV